MGPRALTNDDKRQATGSCDDLYSALSGLGASQGLDLGRSPDVGAYYSFTQEGRRQNVAFGVGLLPWT
jgi:hypothetical protein